MNAGGYMACLQEDICIDMTTAVLKSDTLAHVQTSQSSGYVPNWKMFKIDT